MGRADRDDLDKVFKALGHITRRRILRLLAQNARYPYELSKLLGMRSRVITKHLESLREAGIVIKEPGESQVGPDRTYYRLNVAFGLSTTILPNSFVVRFHPTSVPEEEKTALPASTRDIRVIQALLNQLKDVNEKLKEVDNERIKLAERRGQIIRNIERFMDNCEWDSQLCQRIRSLINPVKAREPSEDNETKSRDPFKEAIKLFEDILDSNEDNADGEVELEAD
ncbi:ArsR family transcriptional regulator [Candidatus Thorarchaeota archaeon]|nr:MAG: ArsR family transcriptional regulator [Candidatus Thorarchaeota archaeon]